jgi:hypothetical protein
MEYAKLKFNMAEEMSDKELLELGRKLQNFYELGYVNKKSALGYTFLKGIAQGFGIFLGGTVVVALVAWILGYFNQIPLAKALVEAIQRSI